MFIATPRIILMYIPIPHLILVYIATPHLILMYRHPFFTPFPTRFSRLAGTQLGEITSARQTSIATNEVS